jgi:hypothetical protein
MIIVFKTVYVRSKKSTIGDTSWWLPAYVTFVGPVATGGSVDVEGAEGVKERNELVLED